MSEPPPRPPARAVDPAPRSARVARALGRVTPGMATVVICLLAVVPGAGYEWLDARHAAALAHGDAAGPAAVAVTRRCARRRAARTSGAPPVPKRCARGRAPRR